MTASPSSFVSEYDAKWSALDVAGIADLWVRDYPPPVYIGDEYPAPLVGVDALDRHWARVAARLTGASVSAQLRTADEFAGGVVRCVLLSRWCFTMRESEVPRTGASWITWLLTVRGHGEQQSYRIFHHMESQVYLMDEA